MGAGYNSANEWRFQAPAQINQAAPIQNTWYTVLAATGVYTHLHYVCLAVLVAGETLECEITCDGVVEVATIAAVAGNLYSISYSDQAGNADAFFPWGAERYDLNLEGHNIQVRIRKTTAAGAGNLQCKAIFSLK